MCVTEKIFFLFLNQNICCGYSKEPPQWDGSFDHPKYKLRLLGRNIFTILPSKILLIWSYGTLSHLALGKQGNCLSFRCRLSTIFKIIVFPGEKSGTLSECQTVWIQIRTDRRRSWSESDCLQKLSVDDKSGQTNISLRSCIPSAIRMWNTLDEGLKNQPTISFFKNNLQITTFPKLQVPNYFTSGNRYLSVIHARIRNNCSNLYNDLIINHLRDNPLCNWCNEIEDSKHYFFHCNNYRDERHLFFETARDFQPLTTQLLLYGNEIVDNTLNSTLFRAVHHFIMSTKRFDNT